MASLHLPSWGVTNLVVAPREFNWLAIVSISLVAIQIFFLNFVYPTQLLCGLSEWFWRLTEMYGLDLACDKYSIMYVLVRFLGAPVAILVGILGAHHADKHFDRRGAMLTRLGITGGLVSLFYDPLWWLFLLSGGINHL